MVAVAVAVGVGVVVVVAVGVGVAVGVFIRGNMEGNTMTDEVNKLAEWMVRQGYATGHGDSMDDLLRELEWQFKEKMERSWEKGVVDGRQIQSQTSIDKAVNAMYRKWVGLTDDERKDIFNSCEREDRGYVAYLVEAKLKEKNT